MSPFFKRRKSKQPKNEVRQAKQAAPEAVAHTSAKPEPAKAHQPSPVDGNLATAAYRRWHAALQKMAHERGFSATSTSVVDLTTMHPTGAAQLYSGMPTAISSLIREESALRMARTRLANLFSRLRTRTEQYGWAPINLALDELTWSELDIDDAHAEGAGAYGGDAFAADTLGADPFTFTNLSVEEIRAYGENAHREADVNAVNVDVLGAVDVNSSGAQAAQFQGTAAGVEKKSAAQGANSEVAARDGKVEEVHELGLLRDVRLEPIGTNDARLTLTAKCTVNPVVLRALRRHGAPRETIATLRALTSDPRKEEEALAYLRECGQAYLPGFTYTHRVLLGSFMHPGRLMLADLEAIRPYIEASGVMASLAGDPATRRLTSAPLPPYDRVDRAPEAERGARDLDVEELAAVEAVASGRSLLIDAPVGSQKLSTLASIVADAAASGRSVLYIPGRSAPARGLIGELESVGLGDLVLDFSNLDRVPKRLRQGLRLKAQEENTADIIALRKRLADVRSQLSSYVNALHATSAQWGESIYSVLAKLTSLISGPASPRTGIRLDAAHTKALGENHKHLLQLLVRGQKLGLLDERTAGRAWAGARITTAEEGEKALRLASRLASEVIPHLMSQTQRVASEAGLQRAKTFDVWLEQITMLEGVAGTLEVFRPEIYERSAADMVIATAGRAWRKEHNEPMKFGERRALTKEAKSYLAEGASPANLHEELVRVQRQRDLWRRYVDGIPYPRLAEGMDDVKATAGRAGADLKALEAVLAGQHLGAMPLEELLSLVRELAAGKDIVAKLPERNEIEAELREAGLAPLVEDIRGRNVNDLSEDSLAHELELVYLSSVFEQLVNQAPILGELGPAQLRELIAECEDLDRRHTRTLPGPVLRAAIRIMRETITSRKDDTLAVDKKLERYGTGALRDVIASSARLVQVARPVWVIPAMMAAEFIPPMPWADIVIIDEADSTPMASSASMLMRGRQIVVMGDSHKAQEDSAFAAFTGVLPCCQLPTYRARYDDVAARALAEEGYGDVVQMLPSAPRRPRPELVIVDGKGIPSPSTGLVEGTQAEVDAVVDQVVNHALTQPEKSLAVVCVSPIHRARVAEAIRSTVEHSSVLGMLADTSAHEPFTVVDVTNCSGLRRDCIVLSLGFGKTPHGRVIHSFGPLGTLAGAAGLVEALAAPREELTIVSALTAEDLSGKNYISSGAKLFARVMTQVAGRDEQARSQGGVVEPLLVDLASRLKARGCSVAFDYGYEKGERIPLVVGSSRLQGQWRVAVLIDDEAYAEEVSLRRRDRYRLERLRERGWIVVPTFSTALFIDVDYYVNYISSLVEAEVLKGRQDAASILPGVPSISGEGVLGEGGSDGGGVAADDVSPRKAGSGTAGASVGAGVLAVRPRAMERPQVPAGLPLAAYSDDQLEEILQWIASDEVERSEEELVEALRSELDFRRRGSHVDRVLFNIVERSGLARVHKEEPLSPTDTFTAGFEAIQERITSSIPVIKVDDGVESADAGSVVEESTQVIDGGRGDE